MSTRIMVPTSCTTEHQEFKLESDMLSFRAVFLEFGYFSIRLATRCSSFSPKAQASTSIN